MAEELWCHKVEREAGERLESLLALPIPTSRYELGDEGFFDPWSLFPLLYGSYSDDFDECAQKPKEHTMSEKVKLTSEERDELVALARFNAVLHGPTFTDRSNWHGALGTLARRKLLMWGDPPAGFTKSRFAGIEITPAGRAALTEDQPHDH